VTSQARARLLRRWIDAYNAHDVDALVAMAHPRIDVVPLGYSVTAPPGTSYHGHAGLRSLLEPGFERYPRLRLETGRQAVIGFSLIVPVAAVLDDGVERPVRQKGTAQFVFEDDHVRVVRTFPSAREAHAVAAAGYGALTPREREVLSMLVGGLTAKQIAANLSLSVLTVRTHIRNAREKLGGNTTYHAIALALQDSEPAR
jgi:DNA-binding CsgD family transcriptional regulator